MYLKFEEIWKDQLHVCFEFQIHLKVRYSKKKLLKIASKKLKFDIKKASIYQLKEFEPLQWNTIFKNIH